ncbi:MAG: PRC-barrel domain-containing protein [Sulfitobacter sp.]
MSDVTSTESMVSSSDVNGTAVYGKDGNQIGHIDHLMIDKETGNVAYAVMGFGGFLGLGEDHHPVPWNALRYDTSREGYLTDIDAEAVKGAPARPEGWQRDRDWERRTFDHFGASYYWL